MAGYKPPEPDRSIRRWAIPNMEHMPVEVYCVHLKDLSGYDDEMYQCYRTSDDTSVFGTSMEYLFTSEESALHEAWIRAEKKAAKAMREWDEIRARYARLTGDAASERLSS